MATAPMEVRVAPNSVYALAGVTFVASNPQARATCWRDLLAPTAAITESEGSFTVQIGPHHANWMTPAAYEVIYGIPWVAAAHACGELALLHLLALDLVQVRSSLEQAGRSVHLRSIQGQDMLLVEPNPGDGVTFLVQQQPMEHWLEERVACTGEPFNLIDRV
jgi:hypothetical protein